MKSIIKFIMLSLFLSFIYACGSAPSSSTGIVDNATLVSQVYIMPSQLQVKTDGTDSSKLTVVALDSKNTPLSNVNVTLSTNIGYLSAGTVVTDKSGYAEAEFKAGPNKFNGIASITATVLNKSITIQLDVSGNKITIDSDKTSIIGNGSEAATLSVLVTDVANTPFVNEYADISTDLGTLNCGGVVGSKLAVKTSMQGKISCTLTGNGSGKSNITVSAVGMSSTKQIEFRTDSVLNFVSPSENSNVSMNEVKQIVMNLKDYLGKPISNKSITITTTLGGLSSDGVNSFTYTKSIMTDASGNAYVYLKSSVIGIALINAAISDLNISMDYKLNIVSNNAVSKLVIQADPSVIPVSTATVKNTSKISVYVFDVYNNPLAGRQVLFSKKAGPAGDLISPISATTDSSGKVTVTYTSGTVATSKDGVTLSASSEGVSSDVKLTVTDVAARVSIGTGNTIEKITGNLYKKDFTVLVTDISGNPIQGVSTTISLKTSYYSASKMYDYLYVDYNDDNVTKRKTVIDTYWCTNEDVNSNGILDTGEDKNGNSMLDPSNVITINNDNASNGKYTLTTASNGFGIFSVMYPHCYATWIKVVVTATAQVYGTEAKATYEFIPGYPDIDKDYMPCASPFGDIITLTNGLFGTTAPSNCSITSSSEVITTVQ